jgi:heat shock protein HslJ
MRVPIVRVSTLIAIGLIAVGCTSGVGSPSDGPSEGPGDVGLANTSWTVTSLAGRPTVNAPRPTMTFSADGRVSGNSGCNQYSGTYRTDGSSISITNVASTMMMCAGPGADVEGLFLKGLNSAAAWQRTEDGHLEIAAAVAIVAEPGVAEPGVGEGQPTEAPGIEIPGSSWVLVEMNGTADFAHIVPTLVFGTTGTVSGFAGCNTFHGTYTPDGHIGELASTKIACQSPASLIEFDYLKALTDVGRLTLVDGRLVTDGGIPLTFEPG